MGNVPSNFKQESVIVGYGGKGAQVQRKMPNGTVEEVCNNWYSADTSRGCIAIVPVERLEEVWDNKGTYSQKTIDEWMAPEGPGFQNSGCRYCYAAGSNRANILERVVNDKTRASFEEFKPPLLRIGKLTEPAHPYYWPTLDSLIDLCDEYNTKGLMFTKMLAYGAEGIDEAVMGSRGKNNIVQNIARERDFPSCGKDISEKLNKIECSLMYSLGIDAEEQGPVSQGFSNAWRIAQAEKYHADGVNVSLTVVCDVTSSIEENIAHGNSIGNALDAHKRSGINYRVIPVRPQSKVVMEAFTGIPWDIAKGKPEKIGELQQPLLFEDEQERANREASLARAKDALYVPKKSGSKEMIPENIHSDFQRLIDKGIGFCGSIAGKHYCDSCVVGGNESRLVFPHEELYSEGYAKKDKKNKSSKRLEGLFKGQDFLPIIES